MRFPWMTCALLAFLLGFPAHAQEKPAKSNILFIAIDDLNDWVGPLKGHPLAHTPHMDRLAARGVTFTNAHCQSPLCNPSRTSLMLSLRPSTTGVYCLEPWFRSVPALKDRVPLTQHLKSNGYETYSVGKLWHGGFPPAKDRAVEFTEMGGPGAPTLNDLPGKLRHRPEKPFTTKTPGGHPLMDWGPFPDRDEEHPDFRVAEWAVRKLGSKPRQPFFLCVGFALPHVPCYAPAKWFELIPDNDRLLPPVKLEDREDVPFFAWYLHWQLPEPRLKWLREAQQWRPMVRAYLASTAFMDAQIGRVLDALEASGAADNTIVVLWSDHGWHLGEKGISGKNTLWDRSTRVPLIFAGPGISKSARCARPAELLDLYPTLVDLCGLPKRDDLEGLSLAPQLKDPAAPRDRPAITTQGPGNHGVRSERWRYIRYADGSEELYDMAADPNEWANLAGDAKHADVKRDLAKWLPQSDAPPAPGSRSRLVELRGGTVYWETKAVGRGDAVPD